MTETYVFPNDILPLVFGANDKNLSYIELLLGADIILKGNSAIAENPKKDISPFFLRLERIAKERGALSESEIFMEYNMLDEPDVDVCDNAKTNAITVLGKTIWPKSKSQKKMIDALMENQIIFALGPAGTGKTFLSVAWALSEVLSGRKSKIVMTRPVVEAGESLGFLPGDLAQKISPYLKPLYDAMEYMITPQHIRKLEDSGAIEISPLAYMRGRSINNSIVILDEAQNTTSSQMKMFLTRLGENSQAIITGDPTQVDLMHKSDSGLIKAVRLLDGIESISMIRFTHVDTVRSRIVREIIKAYSRENIDGKDYE